MAFNWGSAFNTLGIVVKTGQAVQQYRASREEAKAAKANAELMRETAEATRRKYAYDELQRRRQGMRLMSSQKAAAGSSGISIGSFNSIYDETLSETELDALAIRQQGDTEYRQAMARADIYTKQAKSIKKAGLWGAGETLMQGGSDWWSNYQASKTTGGTQSYHTSRAKSTRYSSSRARRY